MFLQREINEKRIISLCGFSLYEIFHQFLRTVCLFQKKGEEASNYLHVEYEMKIRRKNYINM